MANEEKILNIIHKNKLYDKYEPIDMEILVSCCQDCYNQALDDVLEEFKYDMDWEHIKYLTKRLKKKKSEATE